MRTKAKKTLLLTSTFAGLLVATSIGSIALTACATSNTQNHNPKYEGLPFSITIDWNDQESVNKLISDDQGLIFSDSTRREIIAIKPNQENKSITIPTTVTAITGYKNQTTSSDESREVVLTNTGAFENSNIEEVIFEGNTYIIGQQAFKNSQSLTSVKLSKSIEIIDNSAFEGCVKLSDINLNNVRLFGNYAFKNSLVLPKSGDTNTFVEQDGNNNENVVPTINPFSLENAEVIGTSAFESTKVSTISFENSTKLRYIGSYAFKNSSLTGTVDLSKTKISDLGRGVFYGLSGLKDILLPPDLTQFGNNVFEGTGITTLDFSQNETILETKTVPTGLFTNDKTITTIKLPDTIETIAANAFNGAEKLTKLEFVKATTDNNQPKPFKATVQDQLTDQQSDTALKIPNSIKKIENSAFANTGFTKIEWPNHSLELGSFVFSGMKKLKEVVYTSQQGVNFPEGLFANSENLSKFSGKFSNDTQNPATEGTLHINNQVISIGKYAFANTGFTTIKLASSTLKLIPTGAFAGMKKLTKIVSSSTSENSQKTLLETKVIEDGAFYNVNNLTEVDWEVFLNVEKIGSYNFNNTKIIKNTTQANVSIFLQ